MSSLFLGTSLAAQLANVQSFLQYGNAVIRQHVSPLELFISYTFVKSIAVQQAKAETLPLAHLESYSSILAQHKAPTYIWTSLPC